MDLANESYVAGVDRRDPRVSPRVRRPARRPGAGVRRDRRLRPAARRGRGLRPQAGGRRRARSSCAASPDQIHGFFNIVGVGRTSRAATAEIAAKLKAALA